MFKGIHYCKLTYPAKYLSAPGLAWQAALKETKVKLDLLTDFDMLLIIEKDIREEIYHSNYGHEKLITNT